MSLKTKGIAACAVLTIAFAMSACGGSADGKSSTRLLSEEESKRLLLKLPLHYEFRDVVPPEGAIGALAGVAMDKHHVKLQFGVSLGRHPRGVPVPKAGAGEAYGYPRGGFVYTDDLMIPNKSGEWVVNPRFHTWSQWRAAGHIEVEMEEKLCEAATDQPCPP